MITRGYSTLAGWYILPWKSTTFLLLKSHWNNAVLRLMNKSHSTSISASSNPFVPSVSSPGHVGLGAWNLASRPGDPGLCCFWMGLVQWSWWFHGDSTVAQWDFMGFNGDLVIEWWLNADFVVTYMVGCLMLYWASRNGDFFRIWWGYHLRKCSFWIEVWRLRKS